VVQDATNTTTWSSSLEPSSSSKAQGWLYQITSQGLPRISCIFSNQSPDAAVRLVSQSEEYNLKILQGASLNVQGPDGAQVRRCMPNPQPWLQCFFYSSRC
jgi:hypothetical protein